MNPATINKSTVADGPSKENIAAKKTKSGTSAKKIPSNVIKPNEPQNEAINAVQVADPVLLAREQSNNAGIAMVLCFIIFCVTALGALYFISVRYEEKSILPEGCDPPIVGAVIVNSFKEINDYLRNDNVSVFSITEFSTRGFRSVVLHKSDYLPPNIIRVVFTATIEMHGHLSGDISALLQKLDAVEFKLILNSHKITLHISEPPNINVLTLTKDFAGTGTVILESDELPNVALREELRRIVTDFNSALWRVFKKLMQINFNEALKAIEDENVLSSTCFRRRLTDFV